MSDDGRGGRRCDTATVMFLSPRLRVTESPSHRVTESPCRPVSGSFLLRLQLPKYVHNYPASAELGHVQVIDPFRRDDLN